MTKLIELKSIGLVGGEGLVDEVFYRDFDHRREVGGYFGLAGTPYDSGERSRDQGISKAGDRRARRLAVDLAWLWVRNQPDSELSCWFRAWVGDVKGRICRIAIVALARKLMVALWRYLTTGLVPAGAVLRPRLYTAAAQGGRREPGQTCDCPHLGAQNVPLSQKGPLLAGLPSPVHERSGYLVSRPTGHKVMWSCRIAIHGPGLASRLACQPRVRCGCVMIAPSSTLSRPLRAASSGGLRPALTVSRFAARGTPPTKRRSIDNLLPIQDEGRFSDS